MKVKTEIKEAVIQVSSSAPAVTVTVLPKLTSAHPIIHVFPKAPDPGVI